LTKINDELIVNFD